MPQSLIHMSHFVSMETIQDVLTQCVRPRHWHSTRGRTSIRFGHFQPYFHGDMHAKIPECLLAIAKQICEAGYMKHQASNIVINVYHANEGIPYHVDHPLCGEEIAILNLFSTGYLHWKHPDSGQHEITTLNVGDLLVMSGERRHVWQHAVPPLVHSTHRISVVFRYDAGINS